MGRTSLPDVSAKFVADVEGMLQSLKRAENATRSTASNIDREVGTLTKKLGEKFKLADFGKDVLKGAGLFGGFDIARTASEAIANHYKEAAEYAQKIEQSSARQLANTLAMIRERQSPEEQVAYLSRDIAKKEAEIAALNDPNRRKFTMWTPKGEQRTLVADQTKEQILAVNLLTEEVQALDTARKKLVKTIVDQTEAERASAAAAMEGERQSDQDRRIKSLSEGLEAQEKAYDALLSKQGKAAAETAKITEESAKLAEKYRELADPTLRFTQQMAEANQLAATGAITFAEAARAVDSLTRAMEDDRESRVGKALKDFFGDLDEQEKSLRKIDANSQEIERIVGRAADGMADAWVDSLKGVEGAWGNLGDAIVTEIMRVAAQILIVKPMINGLGGILSGMGGGGGILGTLGEAFSSYGGAKASGGGVGAGYTYRVNEDGQEFFRPNVGGTIIPVGASGAMRGDGGRGGDTFAFNYNFASGIQRQEILPILTVWQRETLAKIADAKRRRTSLGAALA